MFLMLNDLKIILFIIVYFIDSNMTKNYDSMTRAL